MLLYGKQSFFAAPCEVARRFATLVEHVPLPGIEEARAWLVFAGQIEQAVHDSGGHAEVEGITDAAAALLLDALENGDTRPARLRLLMPGVAEKLRSEAFRWKPTSACASAMNGSPAPAASRRRGCCWPISPISA